MKPKKSRAFKVTPDGKSIDITPRLMFFDKKAIWDDKTIPDSDKVIMAITVKNPRYSPALLKNLRKQIESWRDNDPDHYLIKDLTTEEGENRSLASRLEWYIRDAERAISEKDIMLFGSDMYQIGELVGAINHHEGWHDGLHLEKNRAIGRLDGAKTNKAKADKRKKALRTFAVHRFTQKPFSCYDDIATEILSSTSSALVSARRKSKDADYTREGIKKIIRGCFEEAKQKAESNS